MILQTDIFGKSIDINIIDKKTSYYRDFRLKHGFDDKARCKSCKYLIKKCYQNKIYYKCSKLGVTNSRATDIRLKHFSCDLYEKQ